jgi:hypothetical protein
MPDKTRIDWTNLKKCETPEELEEAIADMSGSAISKAHAELICICEGLVIDSGKRRNGRIVWVLSEKGRRIALLRRPSRSPTSSACA